ncbi:MAG: dihydrofolate reductase family protein [Flavobacteriales bacterium]
MKKIVYYVSVTLDGFISGENDDISQFIMEGQGINKYKSDLEKFKTTIMGRKTYEFGYKYGLEPGQPAYPNMRHYIFSNSMKINNLSEHVSIEKIDIESVNKIISQSETDIYLCGGGEFAGWLLKQGLIDQLKLKLNPVVIGSGIKLFGSYTTSQGWNLIDSETFPDGLQILTYNKKD